MERHLLLTVIAAALFSCYGLTHPTLFRKGTRDRAARNGALMCFGSESICTRQLRHYWIISYRGHCLLTSRSRFDARICALLVAAPLSPYQAIPTNHTNPKGRIPAHGVWLDFISW